jgi:hypothetical protein
VELQCKAGEPGHRQRPLTACQSVTGLPVFVRLLRGEGSGGRGGGGAGRAGAWRSVPRPIEEVRASILAKLAAIGRSTAAERLAQGWVRDEAENWIPPGWERTRSGGGRRRQLKDCNPDGVPAVVREPGPRWRRGRAAREQTRQVVEKDEKILAIAVFAGLYKSARHPLAGRGLITSRVWSRFGGGAGWRALCPSRGGPLRVAKGVRACNSQVINVRSFRRRAVAGTSRRRNVTSKERGAGGTSGRSGVASKRRRRAEGWDKAGRSRHAGPDRGRPGRAAPIDAVRTEPARIKAVRIKLLRIKAAGPRSARIDGVRTRVARVEAVRTRWPGSSRSGRADPDQAGRDQGGRDGAGRDQGGPGSTRCGPGRPGSRRSGPRWPGPRQ